MPEPDKTAVTTTETTPAPVNPNLESVPKDGSDIDWLVNQLTQQAHEHQEEEQKK